MKKNVSLYVRQSGTRKYIQTTPTGQYPMGTIFVLRYLRDGKRCWETLTGFQNYQTAAATAMRREIDLFTGEYTPPAPKPTPTLKPVNSGLMRGAAIDRYVANDGVRQLISLTHLHLPAEYGPLRSNSKFTACRSLPLSNRNQKRQGLFEPMLRKLKQMFSGTATVAAGIVNACHSRKTQLENKGLWLQQNYKGDMGSNL